MKARRSKTMPRRADAVRARRELAKRLRHRRDEIEEALRTRMHAIADPGETADPRYVEGLKEAVATAVEYGIAAVERSGENEPEIPIALLAQARSAARNGVTLDTVMRRYFAGYTLLSDLMIQESQRGGLVQGDELKHLLRVEATLFDRLLASVSEEYRREEGSRLATAEQRRGERLERLLSGQLLEAPEFRYDFDAWHIGILAIGPSVSEKLHELASSHDFRILLIDRSGVTWAWLGTRRKIEEEGVAAFTSASWPPGTSVALGEPAEGLSGWRLTHRQASAALPIALRKPGGPVRYRDVAVLTSVLHDDIFAASLRQIYLKPISSGTDGELLRETLRAYLAADRNVSSAAVVLGVKRHTVTKRLRVVEDRIGQSLSTCMIELDTALRLEAIELRDEKGQIGHSRTTGSAALTSRSSQGTD